MTFHEIEIRGSLMSEFLPPGTAIGNGNARVDHVVVAGDVLAQIAAAEREGIRTLLLVSECLGGDANAGLEVYAALRRFSRAGGRSIAFVQGYNASTAPLVIAACDFVLMRYDGSIAIHASHGHPDACARADEIWALLLHERTGMPIEKLRGYQADVDVCCVMHDLSAERLGWCDWTPCRIEDARWLAGAFAQGIPTPETPRTRRLAGLASSATHPAPELAAGAVGHQVQRSESTENSTATALERSLLVQGRRTALCNWTKRAITAGHYESVAWSPTLRLWCAVGGGNPSGNACSTSPDGEIWTARTVGIAANSVVWADSLGLFVAVGNSTCATSPDGFAWTIRSIPAGTYQRVAWNGVQLVAVGLAQACATSSNGTSWTPRTIPAGSYSPHNYSDVTWNGAVWCAVGSYGDCSTSADGITWAFQGALGAALTSYNHAGAVCAIGSRLVVMAQVSLQAAVSDDDGVTWATIAVPSPGAGSRSMTAMLYTGSVLIGIDRNGVGGVAYTSPNGEFWSITPAALPGYLASRGLAWNGSFACVTGWSDFCATSQAV